MQSFALSLVEVAGECSVDTLNALNAAVVCFGVPLAVIHGAIVAI